LVNSKQIPWNISRAQADVTEIADLLDHPNVSVTLKSYQHVCRRLHQRADERIDEAIGAAEIEPLADVKAPR
jgi:hypothetical protein